MSLSGVLAQQEFESEYKKGIWNAGTYKFGLYRVEAGLNHNRFNDPATDDPSFRFLFMDDEGEVLESNCIRLTKGLAYNDKAKLWEYLGAIAGKPIVGNEPYDMAIPGVEELADLDSMPFFFTAGEKPVTVESIKIDGKELIGTTNEVNITVTLEISSKGKEYNKIKTIAPVGGGGKRSGSKKPEGAPV